MASVVTDIFKKNLLGGALSLSATTIQCSLVTNSIYNYTANEFAGFTNWTDVSSNEISGTGYSTSGISLSGVTLNINSQYDYAYFDATDVEWTGATFTTVGAVLWKAGTNGLIAFIDFVTPQSPSNGTFIMQFDQFGILKIN
jgi:hypothetical protein